MTLKAALQIKEKELITLVGGGGKTTLMFALGRELAGWGKGIILTTTTKIWKPLSFLPYLFLNDQWSDLLKTALQNLSSFPFIILAQKELSHGKLQGLNPKWIDELFLLDEVCWIIVEADGAAGRSLKAPKQGEPVVPQKTTLLIPVVGIDVLGAPLEEEYVFRAQIATRILGVSKGSILNPPMIGKLLLEIGKDCPSHSRFMPFINKVDVEDGVEKARKLAETWEIYNKRKVFKVILGQAQKYPPVVEVYDPLSASFISSFSP